MEHSSVEYNFEEIKIHEKKYLEKYNDKVQL